MHKTLERQLKKAFKNSEVAFPGFDSLISLVNEFYEEVDRERKLKDRSMELMSLELNTLNRGIREKSEEQTRNLLESIQEGILILNSRFEIQIINSAILKLFNIPKELSASQKNSYAESIWREKIMIGRMEFSNQNSDLNKSFEIKDKFNLYGQDIYLEITVSSSELIDFRGYIVVLRDVTDKIRSEEEMKTLNLRLEQKVVERTRELEELNSTLKEEIDERKAAETTIEFLAYHDPLTGLMNRVALKNYLTGQLADALEKNSKIALFFLDLDRFKMVNDSLGHQIGDELLKHVALRIEECLEHKGRVCRQGGDEFILAVPEFKDKEALKELAEKLIHKISENYKIEGHEFNIDTSIGISIYPEHGQDMESLIRNADIAMYTAKDLGRNNYQFYSIEMSLNVYEQLMLESRLKAALKKNEFRVFYQPKVNASTGIIEGFEALIRWIHPEFGMVSPAKFIPIAEQKGYIISIGEWVLKEACAQAKEWSEKGYNLNVAVNLSPLQFNKDSIITDISGALKASELDPGLLELEITESGIMKDADKAIRILDKLKRLGVSVSIDDFGTGYSSLSHLKKFPIQKLKIDQSFVRDIPQDKENMAITRSIVDLAKNLGLKTIAEGVETEEQSEFLKSIGCDQLQGYYFGKPQPLAAVNEILEKKKNNYK